MDQRSGPPVLAAFRPFLDPPFCESTILDGRHFVIRHFAIHHFVIHHFVIHHLVIRHFVIHHFVIRHFVIRHFVIRHLVIRHFVHDVYCPLKAFLSATTRRPSAALVIGCPYSSLFCRNRHEKKFQLYNWSTTG
jgi:hypothetical protein